LKAIIIDDEVPCVEELAYLLRKYADIEIVGTFTSPVEALAAAPDLLPDVVFLDIDMPRMDGLELALKIQTLCVDVAIVFVTAYSRYALEAFKAYPLDYLLKPIKEARLDNDIEHLRRQYALMHPANAEHSGPKIRCFGHFQVSAGEDISWGTRRVRDLLMYLIDRCGATPTRSELIEALFGGVNDKRTVGNLYVTIYKLRSLLHTLDDEGRYLKVAEDYALTVAPDVCDYVDFMRFAGQTAPISAQNAAEAARMLSLCAAPYLEGEDLAWVTDTASVVDTAYERIALSLAGYYVSASLLPEAERILITLLARNPLSEEGYAALLDLYIASGNHTAYVARYQEYARTLRQELHVRPDRFYRNHYTRLKM
jgi:two-component system LytT family response regulator